MAKGSRRGPGLLHQRDQDATACLQAALPRERRETWDISRVYNSHPVSASLLNPREDLEGQWESPKEAPSQGGKPTPLKAVSLMGTPVPTTVTLPGHLCELFPDTLEQMSCWLWAHGECGQTVSCLIFSAHFLLTFTTVTVGGRGPTHLFDT